jgi:hypothetical protein
VRFESSHLAMSFSETVHRILRSAYAAWIARSSTGRATAGKYDSGSCAGLHPKCGRSFRMLQASQFDKSSRRALAIL